MSLANLKRVTNPEHKHGPCHAWFDDAEQYRYALAFNFRENAGDVRWLVACLLNPSTADPFKMDPTATKVTQVAIRAGYRGLTMVNAFAYRSTDPNALRHAEDPVGPANDAVIAEVLKPQPWMPRGILAVDVLAGWGNHGAYMDRHDRVRAILAKSERPVFTYAVNGNGTPKHPLYVSYAARWKRWPVY